MFWCRGLDLVTADCPPSVPRQCAGYSRAQYYSLPPAARFLPSVSMSRYLDIYTWLRRPDTVTELTQDQGACSDDSPTTQ